MQNTAFQQCIVPTCGMTYSIHELRTECEKCGNLIDVRYHNHPHPKFIHTFYERRNHQGNIFNESGVWRFRELLNFPGVDCEDHTIYSKILVSLDGAEGRTKPFHLTKVAQFVGMTPEKFWLQFEGDNPTGSFKDNGMATAFTHAKMLGQKRVACASTGNTSSSAAAFAANEWMKAIVFIGEGKIARGKLAQTLDYGVKVVQIKGDFDDVLTRVKELSRKYGLYLVNSLNAFRLEGQKTMMYRILDYLDWTVPDWIVFPGGNLGNTAAFGKAFQELKEWGWIHKLPRLAVINARGANTLSYLYNTLGLTWNQGHIEDEIITKYYKSLDTNGIKAKTQASAIEILKPANLTKALRTLEDTNGIVIEVTDQEMLDARAIIGRNGFGCELASAATVAGIKNLVEQDIIAKDDATVGILTGHMLKDPDTIIQYHYNPDNPFANAPISVENHLPSILSVLQLDE
ncbi:MAG: threonine synthase [Candidatus Bathyarchaeota archaeon]|jgi:threonine synthase|nr:threonine synthase [Candidatus Bathyarchaeota archaeon]